MSDAAFRDHVLELLRVPHAHATFEEAIEEVPASLRGRKSSAHTHTLWQLLEHLRLVQWDILEFVRNPAHESPRFPEGYWPEGEAPPDPSAWDRSTAAFLRDRRALEELAADPSVNLLAPVPDAEGPTLLHELIIVAAHNSYHLGQFLLVRRALGA